MEKMKITAKSTLSEAITILDLKPGQKKKGKTPTRLKLTTSEEPLVQIHGSTLYATGRHHGVRGGAGMKVISRELAEVYHDEAVRELDSFYNSMSDEDMSGEYFKWIALKTRIILDEKTYSIPDKALPSIINNYEFNYLYPEKQTIILKYYKAEPQNNRYILNAKKSAVSEEDKNTIIHSCILKRGTVIWVEFGYNIGCEFGGKHPALILKNCKESVIVVPISSKAPTEATEKFNVPIDKVYNFPLKKRWTNILRLQPVSIQRIDFLNRFGSVSNSVLKDISNKIGEYGIK